MPKISIVILTYNSSRFILPLIKSIFDQQKKSKSEIEIIIVDNNSTDNTLNEVKKFGSKLILIENKENLGFARGINIGANKAKGEYLLFINPDTKFIKGSVEDLIPVFNSHKNVGIVGGKLVGENGKIEKSAGRIFGFWETILIALGLDEIFKVRSSPQEIQKVGFVSGGFMMVKKELFEKLNGFDENYFMYIEDMELCFRAKKYNYLTVFTPDVILNHEGHGSSNRSFAIENIYKGLFYFHKKNSFFLLYLIIKCVFLAKSALLVMLAKIINNKYLRETYSKTLKI